MSAGDMFAPVEAGAEKHGEEDATGETPPKAIRVGDPGYERAEDEWYVDEPHCTDLLVAVEPLVGRVWDPCTGLGTIARRLRAAGHEVLATDLRKRGFEDIGGLDFLHGTLPGNCPDNIVMNPPFGRAKTAQAFVERAVALAPRKVCALLPLSFLASEARFEWWGDYRPARVWIISNRPSMPPGNKLLSGEIKAQGGKTDYCWVVWANDEHVPDSPAIDWIGLPEGELNKRRKAYPVGWWL